MLPYERLIAYHIMNVSYNIHSNIHIKCVKYYRNQLFFPFKRKSRMIKCYIKVITYIYSLIYVYTYVYLLYLCYIKVLLEHSQVTFCAILANLFSPQSSLNSLSLSPLLVPMTTWTSVWTVWISGAVLPCCPSVYTCWNLFCHPER